MPLCSSVNYKCVEQVQADYSDCFHQCSGLLVTSYDKEDFLLSLYMSRESPYLRGMIDNFEGF